MKKIKSLFIIILLFAGYIISNAQLFRTRDRMDNLEGFDQQKFSYGFYLAGNSFDYRLVLDARNGIANNQNLVSSKSSTGFGAGLIARMRIDSSFDLRLEPGLQFVDRELTFNTFDRVNSLNETNTSFTKIVNPTEQDKKRKVKATYVDIPILVEYHGDRWYNSRPYVAAGLNWMVNLQSNASSVDDNEQGQFRTVSSNFAWSAEMGFQFYFSRFKLTTGLRGTFMFNNELVDDNPGTAPYWTGSLNQINTRAFMFVLKFE